VPLAARRLTNFADELSCLMAVEPADKVTIFLYNTSNYEPNVKMLMVNGLEILLAACK
jgi:hypothetical protein